MIDLYKADIEMLFDTATTQEDYIIGLYKMVYPDWDTVASVDGHPKVSPTTAEYLMKKAISWDRAHLNPNEVLPGGAWMNYGFSRDDSLSGYDWCAIPAETTEEAK